jgi:hypothetical protein
MTTHFQQLADAGLELSAPEAMDDATLLSQLWEVFDALADIGVFVTSTNHLSDRDLYTVLWQRVLREEVPRCYQMIPAARGISIFLEVAARRTSQPS